VSSSPTSLCFVAPKAYPALAGREDLAHVGGAERQQVLLAEELVRRGHNVSFVVLDHGQSSVETVVRGIKVFTCYRLDDGIRGLRFFHPRLSGLWGAMRRADAAVYYQRGAEAETGLVGHWCRWHGRAFVFAAAHDTNCMARSPLLHRRSERALFRYGLRLADAVVAQTSRQQELLRNELGVQSTVIRSCFSWQWNSEGSEASAGSERQPRRIVWVGRLSEEKRPEWVIRLARDLPDHGVDIVGQANDDSEFGRRMTREIGSLSNVRWLGYVPHHKMPDVYRHARLLLCTSASEGFPNVFLEAWSCGTGVLSTVDPDGVIARFRSGEIAADYEGLKRHLQAVDERQAFWDDAGRRGREYVRDHHGLGVAGDALVQVIAGALTRRRAGIRPDL
jgi:glycosyltransferase involved in cell wall biosynthesis